jgi:arabinofuranosyltransferase
MTDTKQSNKRAESISPMTIGGIAVVAIAFLFLVYSQYRLRFFTWDDSYITFRHSLNMARGYGLVYNPGEKVDGITNYLLAWILGNGIRLGIDPEIFARWIGIISSWIIFFWTWHFARVRFSLTPVVAGSILLMLGTSGMFILESMGGLETTLFTLFVFWLLWEITSAKGKELSNRTLIRAGVASGLAMLTRPDAAFFIAIVMLLLFDRKDFKSSVKRICIYVMPILILFLPYFINHWIFYGYPFPNSYYAKRIASSGLLLRGLERFATNVMDIGIILLVSLSVILLQFNKNNSIKKEFPYLWTTIPLFGFFIARSLFIILSGGSWMGWGRFLVPVIPIFYLMFAPGYSFLSQDFRLRAKSRNSFYIFLAFTFMILIFNGIKLYSGFLEGPTPSLHLDRVHIPLGKALGDVLSDKESISFGDAGALPYYSGLINIDPAGLCDKHIAHLKGEFDVKTDPNYIIDRKPSVIILNSIHGYPEFNPQSPIDSAIIKSPRLTKEYEFILAFEAWDGYNLWLFARNDRADDIRTKLIAHPELSGILKFIDR